MRLLSVPDLKQEQVNLGVLHQIKKKKALKLEVFPPCVWCVSLQPWTTVSLKFRPERFACRVNGLFPLFRTLV